MTPPVTRRRFLTISAAALAAPARADDTRLWSGAGLGGALSVRLRGVDAATWYRLTRRIAALVDHTERQFSLFRDSALVRLNRDGRLAYPAPAFLSLCNLAGRIHHDTGGAFDPSVQVLWRAALDRADSAAARRHVGWDRVSLSAAEIRLPPGMALTFNGIAQGWCADRIVDLLRTAGLTQVLVDMGEIVGIGGPAPGHPWQAAIQSPEGRELARVELADRALATSSPRGTVLPDGRGHILSPTGQAPVWSTVSVSAPSAALADALSTGFCLMTRDAIARTLAHHPAARCEALIPA
ncbi:FAD:protein FMN transferase [Thalassovita sp.]|uniref:FAD:protein FMN transferase n=1 Tax=Thalassovita sp. TaxID=1979401 RepID=UPI0029DE5A9C|nr:FAD:protein FMN transferase [Thalassovita sp.]